MWGVDYECIWITVESTVYWHKPTCCYFPFSFHLFRKAVSNWYMGAGVDMHFANELMLELLKYFLSIPFPFLSSRILQYTSE